MTITSITRMIGKQISSNDLLYLGKAFWSLSNHIQIIDFIEDKVGTAGFEPTASCTPNKLYRFLLTHPDCF